MNQAVDTKRIAQPAKHTDTPNYEPMVSQPNNVRQADVSISSHGSRTNEEQAIREERIRQRAYELYVEGGFQDGNADEYWLAAEREFEGREDENRFER
jgi:hypothetical protein